MNKRVKIIFIISVILLAIIGCIMFVYTADTSNVPNIYATSQNGSKATAIKLGYSWNSFNGNMTLDAMSFDEIEYSNDNILLVLPGEKITLKTSAIATEKSYKFYPEYIKYYDKANNEVIVPISDASLYKDLKYVNITVPAEEGTYTYLLKMNYYKKGIVEYALKVVVSSDPSYNVSELIKYKNTLIGDDTRINSILDLLPYAENKTSFVLRTVNTPYELIVNYQDLSVAKSNFENTSIALFTLIDNLGIVTYKLDDAMYIFSREEVENNIGRSFEEYMQDPKLWEKEVLFKEKVNLGKNFKLTVYKSIMTDILAEVNSNTMLPVAIDISSFEEKCAEIKLSNIERRELLVFCTSLSQVVYESSYEDAPKKAITIHCENISLEDNVYNIDIEVKKERISMKYNYKATLNDENLEIEKI